MNHQNKIINHYKDMFGLGTVSIEGWLSFSQKKNIPETQKETGADSLGIWIKIQRTLTYSHWAWSLSKSHFREGFILKQWVFFFFFMRNTSIVAIILQRQKNEHFKTPSCSSVCLYPGALCLGRASDQTCLWSGFVEHKPSVSLIKRVDQ